MKKVLLAGVTGYLGGYIAKALGEKGFTVRCIVRNLEQFQKLQIELDEILKAEVTLPETLTGCCHDIDVVIPTIGITKKKRPDLYGC